MRIKERSPFCSTFSINKEQLATWMCEINLLLTNLEYLSVDQLNLRKDDVRVIEKF
jgi:hypothetical protein